MVPNSNGDLVLLLINKGILGNFQKNHLLGTMDFTG